MNVLITGASRGIGLAIARQFAQAGHNLLITSKSAHKLYEAVEELQLHYTHVMIKAKAFDLSEKKEVIALGEWCLQQGGVNVIVNNAGIFEPGNINEDNEGVIEQLLQVNFLSAFYITRFLLPHMTQLPSAHIFNISSIAGVAAYPPGSLYSISKYALTGFSHNLRNELKNTQVKVTTVIPGAVYTDSWEGFDNSTGRIAEPGDIAKMIVAATQLSKQACVEEILVRPQQGDV